MNFLVRPSFTDKKIQKFFYIVPIPTKMMGISNR